MTGQDESATVKYGRTKLVSELDDALWHYINGGTGKGIPSICGAILSHGWTNLAYHPQQDRYEACQMCVAIDDGLVPLPVVPVSDAATGQEISEERLAEIEARCEAATEGPWSVAFTPDGMALVETDEGRGVAYDTIRTQDAEFIAAARTDLPSVVSYALSLEAENQRLRDVEAAYVDAVNSLNAVTHLPLSTTIGHLIRSGYLVPKDKADA